MTGPLREIALVCLAILWSFAVEGAWAALAEPPGGEKGREPAPKAAGPPAGTSPADLKLSDARVLEMAKASGLTSGVVRLGTEYMMKYRPMLARDLDQTLQKNPQLFRSQISTMHALARQLAGIQDAAQRVQREHYLLLEAQAERLAMRYKETPESDKPQIEGELKALLGKLFDLRIAEDQKRIEALRKDMETRKSSIRQQIKDREQLVNRDLVKKLGLSESMAW